MSTPTAKTPATQAPDAQPATVTGESAPRPVKAAARQPAAARRKTYALALGTIAALIVAAAIGLPRRPSPGDGSSVAVPPTDQQDRSADADSAGAPHVAVPAASPANAVASTAAPNKKPKAAMKLAATPSTPLASPAPAAETRGREETPSERADTEPAATAPATPETSAFEPVTITGCLEVNVDEDRFRLTDTEGADAPKARSWRTGFLKKRSATVDLVGSSEGFALDKQVGKKIAATGVLSNRSLKISSVRVVSQYCN